MLTSVSNNKRVYPAQAGNALIIGLVVIVLAVGAYLWLNSSKNSQEPNANPDNAPENNVEGAAMPVPSLDNSNVNEMIVNESADNANVNTDSSGNPESADVQPQVKTFTVTGKNFSFDPAEIRVNKGDIVKIVFNNESGFHDWVLDEFNVRAKQMMGPATQTIEFTADKTGTFEYFCSVGQHRQNGMKGNLIVE